MEKPILHSKCVSYIIIYRRIEIEIFVQKNMDG